MKSVLCSLSRSEGLVSPAIAAYVGWVPGAGGGMVPQGLYIDIEAARDREIKMWLLCGLVVTDPVWILDEERCSDIVVDRL